MGSTGLFWAALLLLVASLGVSIAAETPFRTENMDCHANTDTLLGRVNRGFEGVLEVLSGITEEDDLVLDSPMFQNHLKYVGLSFTAGMTSATVYAKQPLNSTFFQESNNKLYYRLKCGCPRKFHLRKIDIV